MAAVHAYTIMYFQTLLFWSVILRFITAINKPADLMTLESISIE